MSGWPVTHYDNTALTKGRVKKSWESHRNNKQDLEEISYKNDRLCTTAVKWRAEPPGSTRAEGISLERH